ncbi:Hint domain-containing protein [Tropicimonas sediminicola]|uniref:Hint domain-containing protein n=1 Tax=Tropicimonas sediminicola TaxID=1031541 RepID=A0A239ELT5_9RHOB|nr:Hint domain-containing protein [Tropicimonas sediminicola]SNS45529.1 Hint domain-containing protein [Tropicimonas sediminicola]
MTMSAGARFAARGRNREVEGASVTSETLHAMLAGTLVETPMGWRPVEELRAGDLVQTFDGGLRRLASVARAPVTSERPLGLIHVPGGTLNTCLGLAVLPGTRLLLDLPELALPDQAAGGPVLVPAGALVGWRGVTMRRARAGALAVALRFDEEEVVFANTGALVHCPTAGQGRDGGDMAPLSGFFAELTTDAARRRLGLPEELPGVPDRGAARSIFA